MKLTLIRHLWGVNQPVENIVAELKELGYEGIECPIPQADKQKDFVKLLADNGLRYIGMAFTGGNGPKEHFDSMKSQVDTLLSMNAAQITIHSGQDAWSISDSMRFYALATDLEKTLSVRVGHETHRGRVFFNPWVTRDIIQHFPMLKLCIDLSHWVCVAERMHGFDDVVELIAPRCVHLHSRVGYEEGPQVPDPSAPEYAGHLAAHEKWWITIAKTLKSYGAPELTITPEFGPPGYLHTLPHTNVPVADLWKVCNWTANRVKATLSAAI
jgi:hypothetical protein